MKELRSLFSPLTLLLVLLLFSAVVAPAQNQVMGEIQFVGATKAEKTSGVWVDGQYVGYLDELKGDKKVLLLPGEHEITVRQAGYKEFKQTLIVEPGGTHILRVVMERDPRAQYPAVTARIKLSVTRIGRLCFWMMPLWGTSMN